MNGFTLMAESYRKAAEQGKIGKDGTNIKRIAVITFSVLARRMIFTGSLTAPHLTR